MSNRASGFSKLWLWVCIILVALFIGLLPHARITSSVLALLPSQILSSASPALSEGFVTRLDQQLVWLVSAPDEKAATNWLTTLQQQAFLKNIRGPITDAQQKAWGEFYYRHRNALLDDGTRERLINNRQADWVITQLFSPFSGVNNQELRYDPMLLVRGSQLALQKMGNTFTLQNGWLVTTDETGKKWVMIHGELADSASELKQIHSTVTSLQTLAETWKNRYPDATMLSRGSIYYSHFASQQAQSDMTHLGAITVFGVFLLIVWVFRSIRPLFLCLLSVFIGALGGAVATLLVYGEIHLMTFVMSMSIIGISVDYAIYYLVERMVYGQNSTPQESLFKVRPALLLALGTTVAAYLIMMLAPFPGIRQLALFASVGLTCSCLTVISFFPTLVHKLPVRPVPFGMLLLRWLTLWRHHRGLKIGLPIVTLGIATFGIGQLRINDDIALLQALPTSLIQQDQKIGELTGQHSDQTWFLVTGKTQEQAFQHVESFIPALQQAQAAGAFKTYQRLPFYSQQRQSDNAHLIEQAAPNVMARLQETGMETPKIEIGPMNVSVNTWLGSPVSFGWRLMMLTLPDGETGILLPITGVKQSAVLAQLALSSDNISWIERKAQFNQLFEFYRLILSALLLLAFALVTLTYILRQGLKQGLRCILPSLLSLLLALGALGLSGMPLNLFSLLALILVLGIGINYSIFFSHPRGTPVTSLLAVSIALCTTLLTLGMLVMSATPAIQGFGLTLCVGIFSAWLFSPLAMVATQRKKTKGQ